MKKNNKSGVVLIAVVAVSMVLMIFVLGLLTLNVNQVKLDEGVVQRIQAEQLNRGMLARYYVQRMIGEEPILAETKILDGRTFNTTIFEESSVPAFPGDLIIPKKYISVDTNF